MPAALFVTTVDITLEAFLVPFAQHFRAEGWRVDALANGAPANAHIASSFDHRFDITWSRNPLAPGNLFGAASRVRAVVRHGGYDIVHVHTPIAAWVTRYALRLLPRASRPVVIYTAHGFHFYRGQTWLHHTLFRAMERIAAPWTTELVTINAEDFQSARTLGLPDERVHLIPGIGVDTQAFAPDAVDPAVRARVREGLGAASDAVVVTMIAEFTANKRHALALRALAHVRDARVVLLLVGTGTLESAVRAEARERGLEGRVVFAGYRRDIPELLAASDLLLLCSAREGLNRAALEAMASGVPVIGTATRGIADAIGDDEAGWVVRNGGPAALAEVIDAAAGDAAERTARGRGARQRAVREFSLEHIIDAYEVLYAEALAGPTSEEGER